MKFKALLSLTVALATTFFIVSCDDNISTIGQGIQPGIDDIQMTVDEVFLTAETVDLGQDTYLRTKGALLGTLDDDVLGRTKAEFMGDFFTAGAKFEVGDNGEAVVDSVQLSIGYGNNSIEGDSLSLMGVTVYELNKNLKNDFYTSVKPSDYSDMKTILGQRYFRHPELKKIHYPESPYTEIGKELIIEIEKSFGVKLYDEWVKNPEILANKENLRNLLKGIYVTSDFNNKALIHIGSITFGNTNASVMLSVFYSYQIKKKHNTTNIPDSTVTRTLSLQMGDDAVQLNSITDTPSPTLDKTKAYVKSPAGVFTKISIPLGEIKRKAEKHAGSKYMINSAIFSLAGMTEEEEKLSIKNRPGAMLFIHKDSLENFFLHSKKVKDQSTLMLFRNRITDNQGYYIGSNNTYKFNNQNTTAETKNISGLINHYIEKEKEIGKESEHLEFYLIPVRYTAPNLVSNGIYEIGQISNLITPSAAIFRTDKENMRMALMFSKYNEVK